MTVTRRSQRRPSPPLTRAAATERHRSNNDENAPMNNNASTTTPISTHLRKVALCLALILSLSSVCYYSFDWKNEYLEIVTSSTTSKKNSKWAVKIQFWSRARADGSGSAIQDMIYAHAYAHQNQKEYMGACPDNNTATETHQELINALGLQTVLKFDCPRWRWRIYKKSIYRSDSLFTEQYLKHLRSLRQPGGDGLQYNSSKVAVHIRRGDVGPCNKGGDYFRYSPNQLYLEVLGRVNANGTYTDSEVTIFSNTRSTENFHNFSRYNLELDGTLQSAWLKMANAEVFIMSKSSFSMIPAFLNNNTVIYTPFWHRKVNGWQQVDDDILERAQTKLVQLHRKHC